MKKLALSLLIMALSTSAFANNLCKDLTGTWSGTYSDPTQLFPSGNFPISLQLKYEKGNVYGYTLPANDSKAGSFGANQGAYFFIAKCSNNNLSAIYFVKNQQQVCGDPTDAKTQIPLTQKNTLSQLILPYENAMMNANLQANLTQQTQASKMDAGLLSQVKALANGSIQTCH